MLGYLVTYPPNKDTPDRFSPECRKVIGFALLRYTIGSNKSRHFFIQSEVRAKPIVTRSHTFSRASRQVRVFCSSLEIGSLDFFVTFVIG